MLRAPLAQLDRAAGFEPVGREFPAAAGQGATTKMFFVYVLRSTSSRQFYTGHTAYIPKRLKEHELGLTRSTKGRGPWELVHQEVFPTRGKAISRERELKTGKGRDELKRILREKKDGR